MKNCNCVPKKVYVVSAMIKTGYGYKEHLISIHISEEKALEKEKAIKKLQREKNWSKLESLMIDEYFDEVIVYTIPLSK